MFADIIRGPTRRLAAPEAQSLGDQSDLCTTLLTRGSSDGSVGGFLGRVGARRCRLRFLACRRSGTKEAGNGVSGAPATTPAPAWSRSARALKSTRFALWENQRISPNTRPTSWQDRQDRSPAVSRLSTQRRLAPGVCGQRRASKESSHWRSGSPRCRRRIAVFIELTCWIVNHREAIDAALDHGLSHGLIEFTNIEIRLLTGIAFGFR